MDLLSAKVGGFAQKDAKTMSGQMAQLNNQYNEIKVSVGEAFLPLIKEIMPSVISTMKTAAPIIKEVGELFGKFGPTIEGLILPVVGLITQIGSLHKNLSDAGDQIKEVAGVAYGRVRRRHRPRDRPHERSRGRVPLGRRFPVGRVE